MEVAFNFRSYFNLAPALVQSQSCLHTLNVPLHLLPLKKKFYYLLLSTYNYVHSWVLNCIFSFILFEWNIKIKINTS